MDKMILNATAEWNEKDGFWEVYVADEERTGKFNVIACNEWVIPLAEMAFNGIDVKDYFENNWYVIEVESEDDE